MPEQRTKDVYGFLTDFISDTELGLTKNEETELKKELKVLLVNILEGKNKLVETLKVKTPKKGGDKKKTKVDSDEEEVEEKVKTPKKGGDKKKTKVDSDEEEEKVKTPKKGGDEFNPEKTYTVVQLKAFCKDLNLPVSGKKEDLIARLVSGKQPEKSKTRRTGKASGEKSEKSEKSEKVLTEKQKDVKKKKFIKETDAKAKTTLSSKVPEVIVHKNSSGLFIHEATLTVWDPITKHVVGYVKNIDDTAVLHLTTSKIELCREYSLEYRVPNNIECDNSDSEDDNDEKSLAILKKLKLHEDEEDDDEGEED